MNFQICAPSFNILKIMTRFGATFVACVAFPLVVQAQFKYVFDDSASCGGYDKTSECRLIPCLSMG